MIIWLWAGLGILAAGLVAVLWAACSLAGRLDHVKQHMADEPETGRPRIRP